MSIASLSGYRATSARVQLPAWGIWFADVTIDAEATLAGPVALQVADLALSGTVLSGGPYRGSSSYRIIGGAGGWGRELPAKGYSQDAGVKSAKVAGDAAAEAGETLDVSALAGASPGYAFAREAGPAARVLEQLAPRGWYVGEDGVSRIGRRPRRELTTPAVRMTLDVSRGMATLAAESIAELVPGVVVDGLEAVDVWHELGGKGLRTLVWGDAGGHTSRRVEALRTLVAQLFPDYRFRGVTEYRVVSQSGQRLNLQAIRASSGMPNLMRVRVRPGVAGCRADVALGSSALVTFVDGDPARPIVVGFEDAEGPGFEAVVDVGLSAEAVALASLVDDRLTEFAGAFASAVPVPNDGGAAIQTAVKAALIAAGWNATTWEPPTMASSTLRANQ